MFGAKIKKITNSVYVCENLFTVSKELPKPKKKQDFPDKSKPPHKKDREYCLQMCQGTYAYSWNIYNSAYMANRRADFIAAREWANGTPSLQWYASKLSQYKDTNDATKYVTYANLDFKPVAYIPKFRDIVVSYIEKLEFDIIASAINPEAVAAKEELKYKMWASKLLESQIDVLEDIAQAQLISRPEIYRDASSIEELEIMMNMSFKEVNELAIQLGNQLVLSESDWSFIKKNVIEDIFDCGIYALETYIEKSTNRVKVRYVDIVNCFYPNFRGHVLENPTMIGYYDLLTIGDLRKNAGGDISETQWQQVAQTYQGQFMNPMLPTNVLNNQYINTDNTYGLYYNNFGIPVMTLYWEETDGYKFKDVTGADGSNYMKPEKPTEKVGRQKYTYKNKDGETVKEKEVSEVHVNRYYKCRWVVNTDIVFDYGVCEAQTRNPTNIKYPTCPLKVYRVSQMSMLERIRGNSEQIYLAWTKMQNAIARAVPSGYRINIQAFENLVVDGKDITVREAVEIFYQTGTALDLDQSSIDEHGGTRVRRPSIEQIQNGLGKDFQEWINVISYNVQEMRNVTGVNELMDSTTPEERLGVGVAKIAVESAKNSLGQLISVYVESTKKTCLDISQKLQMVVDADGGYEGYLPALGASILEAIKITKDICPHVYGIEIVARATEGEREEMRQVAAQAVANVADPIKGGLYYNDYLRIVSMINEGKPLKMIEAILNYRIARNLEKLQKQAQDNTKLNTESQILSNQEAAKTEIEKETMLSQLRTQEYWEKKKADAWFESQKGIIKTEAAVITQDNKSKLKKEENMQDAMLS